MLGNEFIIEYMETMHMIRNTIYTVSMYPIPTYMGATKL